ncbi:dihydrofolate reductase family protein [Aquamicrobium soli]|jgi:dihydrofolate reductase|uniref:Dihydrofolate reductase family protein n=1 Tax=Aquamicrobium soli TaxID=1811518 RepID=A0ABV7KF37_9HYPH
MRKIKASTFVSLDGVMQAPGGPEEDRSGGFRFGGWTVPYADDTTGAAVGEILAEPYDLLLGRTTYDIFAAYWPNITNHPIADRFNAATKYVATSSPGTLNWQNSQPLTGDVTAALRELKKQDGPDLLIQGSGKLAHTLFASDLIDTFTLLIFPVLLGKGKRLFDDGAMPAAFRQTRSQTSGKGVIIATYERGGEVETGSFM